MDPLIIGLLIASVIGTVTSGYLGWRANKAANRTNRDIANQTNQAQALLAEQQHAWNVEDWQRVANYDSPSAQMQRFRDAGLNPSLIYGQMSNSPQISGTDMPQMHMAQVQPYTPPDFGSPFLSAAQSELALAQARKADVESEVMSQKLPEELQLLRTENERMNTEIKSLNQQVAESARRVQSMDIDDQVKLAQKARIEFQSVMDTKQFELSLREYEDNVRLLNQKIAESKSVEAKNYAEAELTMQELKEKIESWSYRLLGFDLDNKRVLAETRLTNEQFIGQQKSNTLAGFSINAGYAENILNLNTNAKLDGKQGWYIKFRTENDQKLLRLLKQVVGTGNLLFRVGK